LQHFRGEEEAVPSPLKLKQKNVYIFKNILYICLKLKKV
jgi:hypothetical protein